MYEKFSNYKGDKCVLKGDKCVSKLDKDAIPVVDLGLSKELSDYLEDKFFTKLDKDTIVVLGVDERKKSKYEIDIDLIYRLTGHTNIKQIKSIYKQKKNVDESVKYIMCDLPADMYMHIYKKTMKL